MNALLAHRPTKYLLISLTVVGLILVSLPLIIQFGAEYAIKEQGAKKVDIEDINLNLFTGKFELKQLSAQFNEAPPINLNHLFVELEISALFQSRIVLNQIEINGFNALVKRDELGNININGYQLPANEEPKETDTATDSAPLEFALNTFTLSDSQLIYQENNFEQNIDLTSIKISNIKSWEKDSIAKVIINLNEGQTKIKADTELTLFDKERKANGSLSIHGLNSQTYKKFHEQHLDKLNAHIDATINFNVNLAEQINGQIEHDIKLSQINAHYQQLSYALESLNSQGKTTINGKNIAVDAALAMNKSKLTDLETSTLLNAFDLLELSGLHYSDHKATLKQLSLKNISLIEDPKKKKLLNLASIAFNELEFNGQESTLNLALIELKKPDINATLTANKQLSHLALIEPVINRFKPAETTDAPVKEKEPTKPLSINIQQVSLTEAGMLHFNDLSVDPIYSTDLHFNTIEIDHISTQKPANFKLALKQGEYTTIDIDGKGLLFNPAENLTYSINIKQLDLPPVSSYTSKTMGYGIKSGVVDSVIKGSIKQQKIDSKITLKIDSIEVIETDKETAAEISGASGMSIELALSTLEDKNKIIDLEMPIGGDIKKPDFNLSLIINKAMGIAMKAASMSYLKNALQPYSSLLTLFTLAKDAASKISLAPISFEANQIQLTSKQKDVLDKISNILNERPGIKIKACGIASLNDQKAINQQLLDAKKQAYLTSIKDKKLSKKQKEAALNKLSVSDKEQHQAMKTLADKRASIVKAYLSKTKNIDSTKILNCLSAENLDNKSNAVVELVI